MKKIDILDAINKNLDILRFEMVNNYSWNSSFDESYIKDVLGVKKNMDYRDISDMYSHIGVKNCDCHIMIHTFDDDEDDAFGFNPYPFIDECILCHKKYYRPKPGSFWVEASDKNKIHNADIKYELYKVIMEHINDYDDEDDINLYELFKKVKEDNMNFINKGKYFFDNRKKDNMNILLIAGSNEFNLNDNMLKARTLNDYDKILEQFKDIPLVKIDVLSNKENHIYNRSYNLYDYRTLDDIDNLIKDKLNKKYDLVIDIASLKKVENNIVIDYDISSKIDYDNYIKIVDSNKVLNSKPLSENYEVYYHDYTDPCSVYYYKEESPYQYLDKDNKINSYNFIDLMRHIKTKILDIEYVSLEDIKRKMLKKYKPTRLN